MTERQTHWDDVYRDRPEDRLTWFEAEPGLSLELIRAQVVPGEAIIDVGGGASRLVDALLAEGLGPVSVLDVSPESLAVSRRRLGDAAERVSWLVEDITDWAPPRDAWMLWHDRAVFHFLTEQADRARYVAAMQDALLPGGTAILATFAEDGPETCSGLPVTRWAPEALAAELERLAPGAFLPVEARRHLHVTPKGAEQRFQFSVFRRTGGRA